MNIVLLSGGLGNQMFQYAFALSSRTKGTKIYLCDYLVRREKQHAGIQLTSVFSVDVDKSDYIDFFVRLIRKIYIMMMVKKKMYYPYQLIKTSFSLISVSIQMENDDFSYKPSCLYSSKCCNILWGYWQSYKYFEDITEKIKTIFEFDVDKLSARSKSLLLDINSKNSVSIHIRRGDYLNKDNVEVFGNICTISYYENSIRFLSSKIQNPSYFIFSDDIAWVKKNLSFGNAVFVDWNRGVDAWQDMCLISNCKHNILANSTFSWWSAWLNNNPQKIVISPDRFTNKLINEDLIPSDWIKMS